MGKKLWNDQFSGFEWLNSPTRYTAPHVSKATPSCYLYSKQSRRPDLATITTRKAKTKNFEAARFDLDRSKRSSSLRSYSSLLSICVSLPGRVDVLRRDSHKYSKREFEYHRKGFSGVDVSRGCDDGVKHRNGFPFSSEGRKSRGWEGLPNASESWFKNGKIPSREIEVQLPPQKKRKYSPIIWDKEEKEVRISSKNRVAPVIPLSSPPPALPRSSGEVPDAVSNGGASKSPVSEIQSQGVEVSEVKPSMADALVGNSQLEAPAGVYTPLQSEKLGDDDQAQNKMDDQEIFHAPNISLSRWASESDSPRDISDDRCSSTPESGEILRVASVGSRSRTSSSDEEGFSVRPGNGDKYYGEEFHDGYMEADEHGGHAVVHQLYSDSEDDVDLSQIEDSPVPRQGSINMLQGCRSVFEYEKLNKINEGTYGVVYRAKDKKTGEIVALKKVKMDVDKGGDGFPMTALREINILLASNHPSIVGVKEVVVDDLDGVFMVMEYMEHDLKGLMESMKHPFSISEAKFLMLQLLGGVKYLHDNWVLHRDLKTSNLLLSKDGELKICDFGLSRQYGSPLKPYTPLVVTLWYRAPEILLGTKQYSTAIDMWSVGCIMAELLAKDALFKGKSEVDQLDKIFRTLGTPNETGWPGLSKLPGFKANYVKQPYNLLRKKFPAASFTGSPVLSDSGFDLLSKLLTYDPEKRITVDAALSHGWFREFPLPRFDYKPTPSSR